MQIFPQSLLRFLNWLPQGERPHHGWVILSSTLFASSGTVNALLWWLTGRRFGFSSPQPDEEEHPQMEDSFMRELDGHSPQPDYPGGPSYEPETPTSPFEMAYEGEKS